MDDDQMESQNSNSTKLAHKRGVSKKLPPTPVESDEDEV
jgi:hypothetical protein